jgi:SLOG in TRPM, prokaryote
MEEPFRVELDGGREAWAVRVHSDAELAGAVEALGVGGRAALVVVGGAGGLSERESRRVAPLFGDILAPLARQLRATVVDGGTDAGVMRLMGSARGDGGASFPLIGVIVDELADSIGLEPNHTHFVFVPGSDWGDEGPWLARFASVVAGPEPSATVLVNGGEISLEDVRHSIEAGRPVVVLDGSGRSADALAAASRGEGGDPSLTALASSRLVRVVDAHDRNAVAWLLDDVLSGRVAP